jgi:hypothetical protein
MISWEYSATSKTGIDFSREPRSSNKSIAFNVGVRFLVSVTFQERTSLCIGRRWLLEEKSHGRVAYYKDASMYKLSIYPHYADFGDSNRKVVYVNSK